MADFSTVLQQTKFNYYQYTICCEKNVFYFKLCLPDVASIGFILLIEKDPNIDFVQSSSPPVFCSRFNICRTINSSPIQEKNREISTRKQRLKKKIKI
jgi:hypothetical protein